ncbi:MAG: hypothetical protein R3F62_20140 [Planctomycetota bacterium]
MHDDSNQDLPISSGFRVHRRPRRESTPGEALFAYAFVVAIGVALGAAGGAFFVLSFDAASPAAPRSIAP